jgi:pilus assembly protein CpaC
MKSYSFKKLFVPELTVALMVCVLFAAAARADDLVVYKGASVQLSVSGIKKISISDPQVVDVKLSDDGQSVNVTGLAEGRSELRIARTSGDDFVTNAVVRADLSQAASEIKDLLSDVEGLEIKSVGNKIVLKGNILTRSDYDKVTKVVTAYPNIILNLSTFDRSEMNKYVEEAILKDIGLDTVTARVVGDEVVLEGIVYSQSDADRAVQIAKLRVPNVTSLLKVQEVMIETDVQFVQVSVDNSKDMGYNVLDSLGVSLGANGNGVSTAGRDFPVSYGVSATASAQIKALLGNGTGKIVAQPHLSTKSGDVGTYQSGGTKYFSVASAVGPSTLQSVDYGVILKVKPLLQGKDRIQNEVSVEVSYPVADPSAVLTLQKYDTACTSVCKIGESMVISGITQTIFNKNSSKTPLLGDIPLIDLFFSNKTSDKQKTEFVIVVTPRPVFPVVSTAQPYGESHQKLIQDKDKD